MIRRDTNFNLYSILIILDENGIHDDPFGILIPILELYSFNPSSAK